MLAAGKLMHEEGSDHSLADYNRAGVPLLEIVSEPDMTSGAAAAAYGAEIRRIVRFLGVSNGNMQARSWRAPVTNAFAPLVGPIPEKPQNQLRNYDMSSSLTTRTGRYTRHHICVHTRAERC